MTLCNTLVLALLGIALLTFAPGLEAQSWQPGFHYPGGNGLSGGREHGERALTVFDDGRGPALYAGGFFTQADGVAANHIAKWNGTTWTPLVDSGMNGVNGVVFALAAYQCALGGSALYVGGAFSRAGGTPASRIAKWDGTRWTALGVGMNGTDNSVFALAVFDDGTGPALYAGGAFKAAGTSPANYIAKWDGNQWTALIDSGAMNGMGGCIVPNGCSVDALAVFDDGTGSALYAGGSFAMAGSTSANNIAKWDGTQWTALGLGVSGGPNPIVKALTVFDDGSGSAALFAGGTFVKADTSVVNHIAKWDGTAWTALGPGTSSSVLTLTVFNDGSGSALYAGGDFTGPPASRIGIAKWDGTIWTPLGSGIVGQVGALAEFDTGGGPALYAVGLFGSAGGVPSNNIAKWAQ